MPVSEKQRWFITVTRFPLPIVNVIESKTVFPSHFHDWSSCYLKVSIPDATREEDEELALKRGDTSSREYEILYKLRNYPYLWLNSNWREELLYASKRKTASGGLCGGGTSGTWRATAEL